MLLDQLRTRTSNPRRNVALAVGAGILASSLASCGSEADQKSGDEIMWEASDALGITSCISYAQSAIAQFTGGADLCHDEEGNSGVFDFYRENGSEEIEYGLIGELIYHQDPSTEEMCYQTAPGTEDKYRIGLLPTENAWRVCERQGNPNYFQVVEPLPGLNLSDAVLTTAP